MRLESHIIGCLNMFMADSRGLTDVDVGLAQALADVATIAIIQDQATRDSAIREGHLQHALTSRISIEQAKEMVAKGTHCQHGRRLRPVRAHARDNNRSLTNVADALVQARWPSRPLQSPSAAATPEAQLTPITGRLVVDKFTRKGERLR